ncbi:WG repeat-containing protein [Lachnospiraceae bacterium 62-35]
MKKAVTLALTAFFILGWVVTVKGLIEKPSAYYALMKEAQKYEEQKIYVMAIERYKDAQAYQPDSLELKMKIAENYRLLGDGSAFVNRSNEINSAYNYPVANVERLADYYIENKLEKKAISLLQNGMKVHKNADSLKERFEKLRYTYTDLFIRYEDILDFRNDSAVVMTEERYGVIDTKGNVRVRANYNWAGALSSDRTLIPVLENGEYFYVNERGYRILVPETDQKVEALGVFCSDVAPAKINGKYGYIDNKFHQVSPFEWDGATVIQNKLGAVKQGDKWAVINSKYDTITDFIYEEIKTDDYGYCSISGRIFAKTAGGYVMLNDKGEQVTETLFEDAKPFLTEQPTAVKVNGKWGFVDLDGNMVIEPQYADARPFSNGLAPVMPGSSWGYITQENQLVIEDKFLDAKSFYKGVAPVKENSRWSGIKLNVIE